MDDDFDDDKVIVCFDENFGGVNKEVSKDIFTLSSIKKIISNLTVNLKNKIKKIKDIGIEKISDLSYIENPKIILNKEKYIQIVEITIKNKSKENVLEMIDALNDFSFIKSVEPKYKYVIEQDYVVADSYYSNQWGLHGSYGINVNQAWDLIGNGNRNTKIKVGIFETNMQLDHQDLDTFTGNFTPNSNSDATHGTHVAGIIGATMNSIGIAGVSQAEICLLNTNNFANSISWAISNGIKIINGSFHYVKKDNNGNKIPSGPNQAHINALLNYKNNGGIYVSSAGNDGKDNDIEAYYPAGYANRINYPELTNVFAVGSINSTGEKSSFSHYGDNSVQVYAPGNHIYSTYPNNSYTYLSGTSMAAPHLSGTLALLLSIKSSLTVEELGAAILNSTNNLPVLLSNGSYQTLPKLDAYSAVKYVLNNYGQYNYQLTEDDFLTSQSIYPSSLNFYEKNIFIKFITNITLECDFIIEGDDVFKATFFDSDFNELLIIENFSSTNKKIVFESSLDAGEYYLFINSTSVQAQNIYISVSSWHGHSYTRYRDYSTSQHRAICGSCGEIVLQYHIITNGSCVLCGYSSSLNNITNNLFSIETKTYITDNGTYITESGVIYLSDLDYQLFLNGQLDVNALIKNFDIL